MSSKILLDTTYILPALGVEVDIEEKTFEKLRGLARSSRIECLYTPFNVLEAPWKVAKTPHDPKVLLSGLESVEKWFRLVIPGAEEYVKALVPTAKLGSVELPPKNFETIKINNRTYIKLTGDKPLSERFWPERKNETLYRMEFRVEYPEMSIQNLSEYKIDDESVRVLLNYTNASYVRLYISLYYLEFDYVDIFGKRFYTNFGHYDSLRCSSVVNVTDVERNKWISAPVSCEG